MGGWLSYMWRGEYPDVASPVSGLTRREIHAVQKSWIPINADALTNGKELMRRYLIMFPEDRMLFRMIRDLPEEQYINSSSYKAHLLNVMNTFNMVIKALDEPDLVAAMMKRIGGSHSLRNITEHRFHGLKEIIMKMFTEDLKLDQWTLTAWSKTIDFWFINIFITLTSPEGTI